MFVLATLIGIYGYLIFLLGIGGLLYKSWIGGVSLLFFLGTIWYVWKKTIYFKRLWVKDVKKGLNIELRDKYVLLLFILIICQGLVNLVGVFGPELSFDALWYHLTIPKLFLLSHAIHFIPGNLLYYSEMPKLTELLYVPVLAFGSEIVVKLVHFSFGILTLFVIYKIARKFVSVRYALLACVIFYTNLVVSWESITAYIDLARTFFEAMAMLGFLNYVETRKKNWLLDSAVMLGLAVATKLIAFGSLIIFAVLILSFTRDSKNRMQARKIMSGIPVYLTGVVFITLPWFVISFVQTGNPLYPFFTSLYPEQIHPSVLNPVIVLKTFWELFTYASDPINPLYIMIIPLILVFQKKFSKKEMYLVWYSLVALFIWYLSPQTGGGRFILPYLPIFSVLVAVAMQKVKDRSLQIFLFAMVCIIGIMTIGYRGIANKKYVPVLVRKETKAEFLQKNLNFSFGDFYDTDGFFAKAIRPKDKVLLYGFHNLYYINFPFIDQSWIKKGDRFNYIATQNVSLPKRFNTWELIYSNSQTHVNVYSLGGLLWAY